MYVPARRTWHGYGIGVVRGGMMANEMAREAQAEHGARHRAIDRYCAIEDEFMAGLEATGIAFAARDEERAERTRLHVALKEAGARIRNGGASVALGPLSVGCVACTGPCVSRSFALTNNCHRDCFFCFNPNQEDFAYWCEHPFPWRRQLDELAAEPEAPACIALTGGEPLLMADEAVAFFARAAELFPRAHLRLYTSGDLLTRELIDRLAKAGLDEIRFSVKQDDEPPMLEKVYERMAWAREVIPTIMVEMPVIPGTEIFMERLLVRLDGLGVDGVNLLEFAYAMWNWPVFESLGLTLRNPPRRVLFDYTYAGALAVQGSEEACLGLMLWARQRGLRLSLHYCSLENKHRAQVRNMNEASARIHPCYGFDYDDYFLKTALAFGADQEPVRRALRAAGCTALRDDPEEQALSFHPRWIPEARRALGSEAALCLSTNVIAQRDGVPYLRELKVEPLSSAPLRLDPVTDEADEGAPCLGGYPTTDIFCSISAASSSAEIVCVGTPASKLK